MVGEDAFAGRLSEAILAELAASNLADQGQWVTIPDASSDALHLVVRVDHNTFLWTPVYAQATVKTTLGYASNHDLSWHGTFPISMETDHEAPLLWATGEFELSDSARGLLSRPAYQRILAEKLATEMVQALGSEIAAALKALPFPGAGWVFITGLQSLLLCIAFWYTFMNNYFFGFRVINLTAKTHLLFATLYLVLGLQQLIAIQLLDSPRLWLTLYVLLIATVLANSWLSTHVTIIKRKGVRIYETHNNGTWYDFGFMLGVASSFGRNTVNIDTSKTK